MKKTSDQAPDAHVMFADGSRRHLSTLWKEHNLVLVFLRHLG